MNKRVDGSPNPYYGRTRKLAKVNGIVGFWYENSVNNQRDREGKETNFEAMPHNYADHEPRGVITYHRADPERLYLPIKVQRSLGYEYQVDGLVVPNEDIDPWLRKRKEGTRQGLDNPVIFRNYLLCNVLHLAFGGDWYEIAREEAAVI
jgi:hypothetical protein